MKVLRARLRDHMKQERERERQALEGQKKEIAWGSQIRSYVLHPYTLVKDHRTELETGNVGSVLDGDLGRFIQASLRLAAASDMSAGLDGRRSAG